MVIKEYSPEYFGQLSALIKDHGTIARREIDDLSFEYLKTGLTEPGIKTYCCFENDELISFMISSKLSDFPTWFVRLVCTKKTNFFRPDKIGICALYDTTISYWESLGFRNFMYIQPYIFMSRGNNDTRKGSPKLQEYKPHNYSVIPAHARSEHAFINKVVGNRVFPEDMIVRWCFKDEE